MVVEAVEEDLNAAYETTQGFLFSDLQKRIQKIKSRSFFFVYARLTEKRRDFQ